MINNGNEFNDDIMQSEGIDEYSEYFVCEKENNEECLGRLLFEKVVGTNAWRAEFKIADGKMELVKENYKGDKSDNVFYHIFSEFEIKDNYYVNITCKDKIKDFFCSKNLYFKRLR